MRRLSNHNTMAFNLENYLSENPPARERKWRNHAIGTILRRKYGIEDFITQSSMAELLKDFSSMSRQWRKILMDNPHLRGEDYQEKADLMAHKRSELGYKN